MSSDKAKKKKWKKVLRVLILVPVIIGIVLAAVYFYADNRKDIKAGYNLEIETGGALESKYLAGGELETKRFTAKTEAPMKKYTVYYPAEMESVDKTYPMILVMNGTGGKASKYEAQFDLYASWGFIVVGNEDPQCGTGETASITLDTVLSLGSDSVLYGKIDRENMGVIGYSQGGAGAINAVTRYDNGRLYKTIFTGSAAYALLSKNMGWEYDISRITIPYFMAAGTGTSDDSGKYGENEYAGVSPLFSQEDNYNGITADVFKVRGRIIGAEHGDMLKLSDGYMTAWMLYHLQGNEEAGTVFLGDDAEILHNTGWQDVEKSR